MSSYYNQQGKSCKEMTHLDSPLSITQGIILICRLCTVSVLRTETLADDAFIYANSSLSVRRDVEWYQRMPFYLSGCQAISTRLPGSIYLPGCMLFVSVRAFHVLVHSVLKR